MSVLESVPVQMSVPVVDQVLDLHGDPAHHDLALFMHGSQWMVMDVLLREFQAAQPEVGSVFYETLPPGILVQQMVQDVLQMGDLIIRVAPDVLTADLQTLTRLAEEEWFDEYHEYATNVLAILVARGNPRQIGGWADLLRPDVRVVLPNPQTEGIGRLIQGAISDTLGKGAWTELAEGKRERGMTTFTQIHHRETPLYLMAGNADAGPVWLSEALYQERLDMPLETVRLPEAQNRRGHYGVAVVERTTIHPEAASAFVEFLRGPAGQAIYADYSFDLPHVVERGG